MLRMGDGEPPLCMKESEVFLRVLLRYSNDDVSDRLFVPCLSLLGLRMKNR